MAKAKDAQLKGIFLKLSQSKLLPVIFYFFALYIPLILLSPLIILLVVYRALLTLILRFKHDGKFQIINGLEATSVGADRYANVDTITYVMLVKGACNIQAIRDTLKRTLFKTDEHGRRPFWRLLNAVVAKFGFLWWEDKSDAMDFSCHVRYCPDADDLNKVYTEKEAMAAIAKLADEPWPDVRPRWDFLVVPKVQREDEPAGEYYGIAFRVSHVYTDGISGVQFLRNCLFDQPTSKLMFDPVNPPIPSLPFYKKIILYLQALFYGPYESLRLTGYEPDPVFSEGTLTGEKFYGRMTMDLPLEKMRRIRRTHNCDTQAVLHSACTAAIERMALRRGLPVSEEVLGFVTYGKFPYPDEYPTNRVVFTMEPFKMRIASRIERLTEMNHSIRAAKSKPYCLESALMLVKVFGMLPISAMGSLIKNFKGCYLISNVPGIADTIKINGSVVSVFTGLAPLVNSLRFSIGVGCYNGKFIVGFAIGKTKIITDQKDMDDFIQEFENEVRFLDS